MLGIGSGWMLLGVLLRRIGTYEGFLRYLSEPLRSIAVSVDWRHKCLICRRTPLREVGRWGRRAWIWRCL